MRTREVERGPRLSRRQPRGVEGEVKCVLCGAGGAALVASFPARRLVAEWQAAFGIDIAGELGAAENVDRFRCGECGIEFYPPALAGSAALYSKLEHLQGYYSAAKWEHSAALRVIERGDRVLEVGCGRGEFIRELNRAGVFDVVGIELNPTAVEAARANGHAVEREDLVDLSRRSPGSFDVVCAFQVLEHVPDPGRFIAACVAMLRPGGRLVFGVPNADGFLKYSYDLLDMPPHHITRWSSGALRQVARLFSVRLSSLAAEPLAAHHVDAFLTAYIGRYGSRLPRGARLRIESVAKRALLRGRAHRLLPGHTAVAVYETMAEPARGRRPAHHGGTVPRSEGGAERACPGGG